MAGRSPAQGAPSAPQLGSQDSWAAKNTASLTALAQVEALLGSTYSAGPRGQTDARNAAGDKPAALTRVSDGGGSTQRPLERQLTPPGVGALPSSRRTKASWGNGSESPNASSCEGSPLIRAGRSDAASSLQPEDDARSNNLSGLGAHSGKAKAASSKQNSRDLQYLLRRLNSSVASLRASVSNPAPGRKSGITRIPIPRPLPVPIKEEYEEEEEVSEFEDDDDEEALDKERDLLPQAQGKAGVQADEALQAAETASPEAASRSVESGPTEAKGSALDPMFEALWDTDDDEIVSRQSAKEGPGRARSGIHKKSAESGTLNRKLLALEAMWNDLSVVASGCQAEGVEEAAGSAAVESKAEPEQEEVASDKGKHKQSAEEGGSLNRKLRSLEEAWKKLETLDCEQPSEPAAPRFPAVMPEPCIGTHSSPLLPKAQPKAQPTSSPFAMQDVQAEEAPARGPIKGSADDLKEAISIQPVLTSDGQAEMGPETLGDRSSELEPALKRQDLEHHASAESIAAKPEVPAAAELNIELPISTAITEAREDANLQLSSALQAKVSALPRAPAGLSPSLVLGAVESKIPGPSKRKQHQAGQLAAYQSLNSAPAGAPSMGSERVAGALAMHPSLAPSPREALTNFRRKAVREEELPKLEGPIKLPLPTPQKLGSRLKFWKSAKTHLGTPKDISPPARVQRAASNTEAKQGSRRLSFPGRGRDASPERPSKSKDSFTKQLAGIFRRRSFSGGPARSQSVSPTQAPVVPTPLPSLTTAAAAAAASTATPLQTSRTMPNGVGAPELLLTPREPEQDSWVTPESAIKQLLVPNWVPSKLPIAPAALPTEGDAEDLKPLGRIPSAGPSSARWDADEATGSGEAAPWVSPEAAVKNLLVPSWVPSKLLLQVNQPLPEMGAAELPSSAKPANLIAAVGSPKASGLPAKVDRSDWTTSRVPISDVSLPAATQLPAQGRALPRQPSSIPEDAGAEHKESSIALSAAPSIAASEAGAATAAAHAPEAPSPATAFMEAQLQAMELPKTNLKIRPRKEKGFFKSLFRRRSEAGEATKGPVSLLRKPEAVEAPASRAQEPARLHQSSDGGRVEQSVPSLTLSGLPQRDEMASQSTLSARSIDAKVDFSFQGSVSARDTPSFREQAGVQSERRGPSPFRRRVTDEDLSKMEQKLDVLKANFERMPARTPSSERGRAMSTGRVRQSVPAMFPCEALGTHAGLRARPAALAADAESTPAPAGSIRRKFPSPIEEEKLSPEKASPPAKASSAAVEHPADAAATRSWMESLRTPERVRRAGHSAQATVQRPGSSAKQAPSEPKRLAADRVLLKEVTRMPDMEAAKSHEASTSDTDACPGADELPSTNRRSTTPFGRHATYPAKVRCDVERPVPYVRTPREPSAGEPSQVESPTTALTNALKQTAGSKADKVESPQWRVIAEHVTAKSAVEDAVAAGKLSVGGRAMYRHQDSGLLRSRETSPDRLFGDHGVAAGTVERMRSWTEKATSPDSAQQSSFKRKPSESGEKAWQPLRSPRPKGLEPLMVDSSRPAFPALKAYLGGARSPSRLPQQHSPDNDPELAACRSSVASLQRRFETGLLESNVAALQRQFEQQGQMQERAAVWASEHAPGGSEGLQGRHHAKQHPRVINLTATSEAAPSPQLASPFTTSQGSGLTSEPPRSGLPHGMPLKRRQ